MDLLPEPILHKLYRAESVDSMNHINMFKQHYDDIPRYTKQVDGDRFAQIDMNIPSKIC